GRAFSGPASSALFGQAVPPEIFTSAATWSSSSWQFAAVFGPALGGIMIAVFRSAYQVYVLDLFAAMLFGILTLMIHAKQTARSKEATTLSSLAAGVHFVWNTKVILAAITLDMFAVLLGGAT